MNWLACRCWKERGGRREKWGVRWTDLGGLGSSGTCHAKLGSLHFLVSLVHIWDPFLDVPLSMSGTHLTSQGLSSVMKAKGTEMDGCPYFSCVWMHSVLKLLSGGTPLHFKLRMVYSRATWVRCCRKASDILPPTTQDTKQDHWDIKCLRVDLGSKG